MSVIELSESQARDFIAEYEVLERYGLDRLGLGEWKACLYFDRLELPPTRAIYLLMDECIQRNLEDDVVYVGIAPESLWSRWVNPTLRGGKGHHVLERLLIDDPVEYVEADDGDLYIAYCELPNMPLPELERLEECMIDLLAPRLNRQKTPLHPYKIAFKELHKFAAANAWPTQYWKWPTRATEFYEYLWKHLRAFQDAQMEQAPQWMSGLHGRWNYRAFVPNFEFLPYN